MLHRRFVVVRSIGAYRTNTTSTNTTTNSATNTTSSSDGDTGPSIRSPSMSLRERLNRVWKSIPAEAEIEAWLNGVDLHKGKGPKPPLDIRPGDRPGDRTRREYMGKKDVEAQGMNPKVCLLIIIIVYAAIKFGFGFKGLQ